MRIWMQMVRKQRIGTQRMKCKWVCELTQGKLVINDSYDIAGPYNNDNYRYIASVGRFKLHLQEEELNQYFYTIAEEREMKLTSLGI